MFAILILHALILQSGDNIEILSNPTIQTYATFSNMIVHNVTSIQMVFAIYDDINISYSASHSLVILRLVEACLLHYVEVYCSSFSDFQPNQNISTLQDTLQGCSYISFKDIIYKDGITSAYYIIQSGKKRSMNKNKFSLYQLY